MASLLESLTGGNITATPDPYFVDSPYDVYNESTSTSLEKEMPRLGHGKDLTVVLDINDNTEQAYDYGEGLVFAFAIVLVPCILWMIVLLILKIPGCTRGFLSGYPFNPPETTKDDDNSDKKIEAWKKHVIRTRIVFVTASCFVVLFAILLVSKGFHNLESSKDTLAKSNDDIRSIINDAIVVTDELENIVERVGLALRNEIIQDEELCHLSGGSQTQDNAINGLLGLLDQNSPNIFHSTRRRERRLELPSSPTNNNNAPLVKVVDWVHNSNNNTTTSLTNQKRTSTTTINNNNNNNILMARLAVRMLLNGTNASTSVPTSMPTAAATTDTPTSGATTDTPTTAGTTDTPTTAGTTGTPTTAGTTNTPTAAGTTNTPTMVTTGTPTASTTSTPTAMTTATAGTTGMPTAGTTGMPTAGTTGMPTAGTTGMPTAGTTGMPTAGSTNIPTGTPTAVPSSAPSSTPSGVPTHAPSDNPTTSSLPTSVPTTSPTSPVPTFAPTAPLPSSEPTGAPTGTPTGVPSFEPTSVPSTVPTDASNKNLKNAMISRMNNFTASTTKNAELTEFLEKEDLDELLEDEELLEMFENQDLEALLEMAEIIESFLTPEILDLMEEMLKPENLQVMGIFLDPEMLQMLQEILDLLRQNAASEAGGSSNGAAAAGGGDLSGLSLGDLLLTGGSKKNLKTALVTAGMLLDDMEGATNVTDVLSDLKEAEHLLNTFTADNATDLSAMLENEALVGMLGNEDLSAMLEHGDLTGILENTDDLAQILENEDLGALLGDIEEASAILETFLDPEMLSMLEEVENLLHLTREMGDSVQEEAIKNLQSIRATLEEAEGYCDEVSDAIQTIEEHQWIIWIISVPLMLIPIIMIVGTYLAHFKSPLNQKFLCLLNYFFLPLLTVFVLFSIIFCSVISVMAVANADFCSGSGSVDAQVPDSTVMSAMNHSGLTETDFVYQVTRYYIYQCTADAEIDPFVFLRNVDNQIDASQTLVEQAANMTSDETIEILSQICNRDIQSLNILILTVRGILILLRESYVNIMELLSCDRIVPIYTDTIYKGFCQYNIAGLAWIYFSLLVISVMGLIMITCRSSYQDSVVSSSKKGEKKDDDDEATTTAAEEDLQEKLPPPDRPRKQKPQTARI